MNNDIARPETIRKALEAERRHRAAVAGRRIPVFNNMFSSGEVGAKQQRDEYVQGCDKRIYVLQHLLELLEVERIAA